VGVAIGVASGVAVGVDLGGVVGVVGVATRVAGSTVSLSRVILSWSCRAIVIISLISLRARLISLSVYL